MHAHKHLPELYILLSDESGCLLRFAVKSLTFLWTHTCIVGGYVPRKAGAGGTAIYCE